MASNEFDLEELSGIGSERANKLRAAGYDTLTALRRASVADLTGVTGISERIAKAVKEQLGEVMEGTDVGNPPRSPEAPGFEHVTVENRTLLDLSLRREWLRRVDPWRLKPILFRPCEVDLLFVTDGLRFDEDNFGLQAFVEIVLDAPGSRVRYDVTLADWRGSAVVSTTLRNHPRVSVIDGLDFADPDQFGRDRFDEVWLFGFDAFGSLEPDELRALSEFMDDDGGVFATGDHGALGRALCSEIPRVRSMRLWDDSSGRVGMGDEDRNDTNRWGIDGQWQFDDQADDVPQRIQPTLYSVWQGIWRVSYPHPVLCGPNGVIRVMPDHPHEGECVEPTSLNESETFAGYTIEEYPTHPSTGARPVPEIISTSSVLSGSGAQNDKDPTHPQKFGGICAYDGHRADVGRVVTDATWHHFVNVNIVGDDNYAAPAVRAQGFLASTAGQDHLEDIKTYYRNLATWLAPPDRIECMNRRRLWELLYHHRVIEAVSTRPDVRFDLADAAYVYALGKHARNVLGKHASQCEARRLMLDLVWEEIPREFLDPLDPWRPRLREIDDDRDHGAELPDWVSAEPVLDLALGGALVALRESFPEPTPEDHEKVLKAFDEVTARGVREALGMERGRVAKALDRFADGWTEVA